MCIPANTSRSSSTSIKSRRCSPLLPVSPWGVENLAEQGEDVGNKELILSTHGPLSRSKVLQGSCGRLQGVVVLAAREERQVEPHHLRLVEQLQTFNRRLTQCEG